MATQRNSAWLLLCLILALAAGLRIFNLSALGFWTDEFCTLSCAHGWGLEFDHIPLNESVGTRPVYTKLADARSPFEIIPGLIRDEAHPPLYFFLVRFWEWLWGDSEAAVRSLNVVFSLAAIVLLYFAARATVGINAALGACLLMAVAGPQIEFSQEARNYMPVLAFALAAAVALLRLRVRASPASGITLAVALLAMVLTHYFALGVALALGIYSIFWLRGKSRIIAIAGFVAAAMVFAALWGRPMLMQRPHFQSNYGWIQDAGPDRFRHALLHLGRLPARFIAESSVEGFSGTVQAALGILFLLLPIAWVYRPDLRFWILWLLCAIGLVAGLDVLRSTKQLSMIRYTLAASPAAYVLIAAAVRGRWRIIPLMAAVVFALVHLPAAYTPPWKMDFRTPAEMMGAHIQTHDALLICGPDPTMLGITYGGFSHYLPTMPLTVAALTAPPNVAVQFQLRSADKLWLVWMWPDQNPRDWFSGLQIEQSVHLPYFADLIEATLPARASSTGPGR